MWWFHLEEKFWRSQENVSLTKRDCSSYVMEPPSQPPAVHPEPQEMEWETGFRYVSIGLF